MTSVVTKKQLPAEEEDNTTSQNLSRVTGHIFLKQPANSSDPIDKDVVLRRIRHRRRVNKLKSTVKALLGFASHNSNKDRDKHRQSSVTPPTSQMISWVDDAFAAP